MCPNPEAWATPAPAFSLTFPPDPAWVRTCRETVRTSAALCGTARAPARDPELAELAVLLASESVSNAIAACAAGGCPQPVSLYGEWTSGGAFRVHVRDGAPGVPVVREPEPMDVNGRGMQLIAALANRWGVCVDGPGPGKSLWFQVGRA